MSVELANAPDTVIRNGLLCQFPPELLQRVMARLEWIALPVQTVVIGPDQRAEHVYFVEKGTVSVVSVLENGEQIEVGLIGPEGMAGISVLLGAPTSPHEHFVQVEGAAYRIGAAAFRNLLVENPAMMAPLLRYVDAFHVQVSQTAVCNGHHDIEQRLSRWILMTHDRVGRDQFTMTQEYISLMLGVRRPSVTLAVGGLQRAGLIRSSGGKITVLNRAGLEDTACECYRLVRRRYAWLVD